MYLKREMGDTFCLACGPYCFTTVVSTLGWYHLRFEIRCEGKMIFGNSKGIIQKNNFARFSKKKKKQTDFNTALNRDLLRITA